MNLFEQIQTENPETQQLQQNPIAYFCAEFAVSDQLPLYSGGLGILAGDVIKESDNSGIPLVGVGLFYREGYFKQVIGDDGQQAELPAFVNVSENLQIVKHPDDTELYIPLQIDERVIQIRIWKLNIGKTQVLLLDTDVEGNSESDKRLTLSLYPSEHEWRIQQEIILGIGGVKALSALKIIPSIYHLNEGHSAFAVMEVTRQFMQNEKLDFPTALQKARAKIVFTNHTLVASGNDAFEQSLVRDLLEEYTGPANLPLDEFLEMGKSTDDPNSFSMTNLALNESKYTSAVSKSHAEYAKGIWPNTHLEPITNGVFAGFWQAEKWKNTAKSLNAGFEVSDEDIWEIHQNFKHALTQHLNAEGLHLSPHTLTLTWAKRVTSYKQPLLLFSDIGRLKNIITNSNYPVQIIFSGKAHPSDLEAKAMIAEIVKLIDKENLSKNIFFLPNYTTSLTKILVSGSDVWLNTPKKGQEACGTSGIKSALNGGLQCAISDGWTEEVELSKIGFSIQPENSANSFYEVLEKQIVPLYYDKAEGHRPKDWCNKMRETLLAVYPQFTTERMLKEYFQKLYTPILKNLS